MTEFTVIEPETKRKQFLDDPKVSMIVPIYDLPDMSLKRCLMSLSDQDYTNLEVICVLDGPNPELEKICEHFKNVRPDLFTVLEIEHAGACAARNAGFKASTGEIVSFFNSDYIAKPGMIRMWVDALQANPDCGFAYGGYEYNSSHRSVYPSKNFDPWVLQVANYIDCGFPLWRKYVVEWDVNCKSLQDWDFWLRVVKQHNVKGFYLQREYSFVAEMPRLKGLSHDSANNWIDRVTYVKGKNGIPLRNILVTSIGAPNHGIEIAKLIGADFRDDTFDKPSAYSALYMIGFYIKPNEGGLNEHVRRLAIFKEKYPNSKRVVHFVGADIYWLRKFPFESLKYLAGALNQSCDHILSENQAAHDELKEFGINSEIVPIPSYSTWEMKPLPEQFKVALYLVESGNGEGMSDFDKYCYENTLSIVRGMPDVQFTAYGKGGLDVKYPNLKHAKSIPRDKWPDYVYDNSALLRICRHDTMPMASNEFIMAGRDVITNIPATYMHVIDTKGKSELNEWDRYSEGLNAHHWPTTKKAIIQKIRSVKKGDHFDREAGTAFYQMLLDKKTYINKINDLCGIKGEYHA